MKKGKPSFFLLQRVSCEGRGLTPLYILQVTLAGLAPPWRRRLSKCFCFGQPAVLVLMMQDSNECLQMTHFFITMQRFLKNEMP